MRDSILNGEIEENLSKRYNVKIRKFSGATVDDLNYHVHPILSKKTKHIIVYIGINDATRLTSREILDKLLKLKTLINPYSPNVTFLHPLKKSENLRFSDVFRRYRNVTLGEYGLRRLYLKQK